MLHIVIRDVKCSRIVTNKCRPLLEIGADYKRPWFCGSMDSEARHESFAKLERRRAVHRALHQVRELTPERPNRFEAHAHYSFRRAIIGSMRAARFAGTKQAIPETTRRTKEAAAAILTYPGRKP